MNRPEHPAQFMPNWSEQDSSTRAQLNRQWRADMIDYYLSEAKLRKLDAWEDGALRWCTECHFSFDRTDSYGDCADCGEPVLWVAPLSI